MGSFIKWLLIAIVVIVVLLGGAIAYLSTQDPNQYKNEITQLVKEQTGLNLNLAGDLSWQFWPSIGIRAAGITADWQAQPSRPLLSLEALTIEVAVLPLLSTSPTLKVNGIELINADIYLRKEKDGRVNWEPPTAAGASAPAAGSGAAPTTSTSPAAAAFAFDRITIDNGNLLYEDLATPDRIELKNLEFSVDGAAPGQSFPIALEARLEQASEVNGQLELDARAALSRDGTELTVTPLTLEFVMELPGSTPPAPNSLAATDASALAGNIVPIELRGNLAYNLATDFASVEDMKLEIGGLSGVVKATVEGATGDNPKIKGSLDFPKQDANALIKAFDPNAAAVPEFGLQTAFNADSRRFAVDPITIQIDDSTLAGQASGTLEPRTDVKFALASDKMNVAWLLAPAAMAEPEPLATAEELEADLMPLDTLRETDWNGTVTVKQAVYEHLNMDGFKLTTTNARGRIAVDLGLDQVMNGSATIATRIDVRKPTPAWQINLDLKGLDSKTLLKDLQRVDLDAKLSATGLLTATGNSEAALADSLRGTLDFDGGQGRLDVSAIKNGLGGLGQLLAANPTAAKAAEGIANLPEVIQYKKLAGTAVLAGLDQQDIDFTLDNMTIAADGGYQIRSETIDYRVALTIQDQTEYTTFKVSDYLVGVPIPARCAGPLTGEKALCSVDAQQSVASVVRALGSKAARDKIDKAIDEKVPEQFRDAAKSFLDLLGKKKN